MDTLGHLLALQVTPANEQDRAQVGALAGAVHTITGQHVSLRDLISPQLCHGSGVKQRGDGGD